MNILTIGNSFSWSLRQYFPDVTASMGEKLKIEFANFGGCELARHWSYIKAEKADPLCRIYCGGRRLCDILSGTPWDVVTIQQASHESWRAESFEPFATNIIGYVREFAPQAEIVIQQTWAYRADSPRFAEWNISQSEMHARLTENYRALAARHGLRVIPTGLAVAISRETSPVKFKNYPPELLTTLNWPDLPPQAGDVVGQIHWIKDPETGELKLGPDFIHLNRRGEYMQACLWFAVLYDRNSEEIPFVPEEIGGRDAAFLRVTAERAKREWA